MAGRGACPAFIFQAGWFDILPKRFVEVSVYVELLLLINSRWLQLACTLHPSSTYLPLKIVNVKGEETHVDQGSATILWPWDSLNYLWRSGHFDQWVCDDPQLAESTAVQYWERVQEQDFFERLGLEDWRTRPCIPLCFHADGVKIYKNQKCWVYSMSSACRKGPSIKTKLVIITIREATILKDRTHDAVGRLMGYICDTLQSGLYPEKDEFGQPFSPGTEEHGRANTPFAFGWRGAFFAFKGDWEAKYMIHKLSRYYNATFICERCMASRKPEWTFGDLRPWASCLSVRFTHDQFLMISPWNKRSSWSCVRGWTIERNLEAAQIQ